MQILVVDIDPASSAALSGRVQEALRQVEMKKVEQLDIHPDRLEEIDPSNVMGVFIGPGSYARLEEIVSLVRTALPSTPVAVVLENEIYATEALFLRKSLSLHVMPIGDLAQIASFLIDCDTQVSNNGPASRIRGVIGMAQLKGGVGVTTLVAAFASCWAKYGLSVVAIDLDDINPQLTAWARVGTSQKNVISELLRQGEVPTNRLNEMLNPVEGYEGRLVVVGQPERYNESFHFKADVLDGAPSSAEFVTSLITHLRSEFDVVIIDLGKSWGVATFTALPQCQHVLLVTDDDGMSVRCTLDNLLRLRKESDDPDEFDLSRWSMVLNAYTGRLIIPKELAKEIRDMDLLPSESSLFTIPFSEKGRQWGAPGQSFYDLAEDSVRQVIRKVAYNLVPFRYESDTPLLGKIVKRWNNLINAA